MAGDEKQGSALDIIKEQLAADAPETPALSPKAIKAHDMAMQFSAILNKQFLSDPSAEAYQLRRGFLDGEPQPTLYRVQRDGLVLKENDELIENQLLRYGYQLTASEAKDVIHILKQLKTHSERVDLDAVAPVALADEQKLTWSKLPFTRDEITKFTLEDIPEFKDFLRRCGNGAESVVYFIGSLLDPKSTRSQYLYVAGPGGDGKSALITSLRAVLGPRQVLSIKEHLFNSPHFGEQLEGARLIEFADENGTGFVSGGKFKSFTGDSRYTINPKNKSIRDIPLTAKIIVTSNSLPEITSKNADKRRLIPVQMEADSSRDDGADVKWWYDGLVNSGKEILGYCYAKYLAAIESGHDVRRFIPVDGELLNEAGLRKYEDIIAVIDELYDVTGEVDDKALAKSVNDAIKNELRGYGNAKYLTKQIREAFELLGVECKKSGTNYYRGLKTKSQAAKDVISKKQVVG